MPPSAAEIPLGQVTVTDLFVLDDLTVSGTKAFIHPHRDPSKAVRFVCLEGNESGTYFRGHGRVLDGRAVLEVPDDFKTVTDPRGLTIQTMPIGAPAVLWVESIGLERIVLRSTTDVEFSYIVNGVRKGFTDLETIVDNEYFVPTERGVPFRPNYPAAYRSLLVENGILNPDFTPNEATAARLGWQLREPSAASTQPSTSTADAQR
jgi:hypothetical protein